MALTRGSRAARPFRILAGAVLGAALVASIAPAADAGSERERDRKRDVVSIEFAAEDSAIGTQPRNQHQDIVAVSTTYARQKVRLSVKVRELPRRGFGVAWFVSTADQTWAVGYDAPADELFFEAAESGEGSCGGLRVRRVLSTEKLVVTFPRSCIGPYRWIRTGVWMWKSPVEDVVVVDDGRLAGMDDDNLMDGPRLGRRVHYN